MSEGRVKVLWDPPEGPPDRIEWEDRIGEFLTQRERAAGTYDVRLRQARGRWRVCVEHSPIRLGMGALPPVSPPADYSSRLAGVLRAAGLGAEPDA